MNLYNGCKGIFLLAFIFFLTNGFSAPVANINGPFKISITSYGTIDPGVGGAQNIEDIAALKAEIDNLFQTIQNTVNKDMPEADASTYLKGMSNSGVIVTKGLGVDYASAPEIFVVGAGVGVAADAGDNSFSDLMGGNVDANQFRGFAAQASVMAGLNLRVFDFDSFEYFDPNKLTLFLNFFTYDLPSGKDLSGEINNFGIHGQYQIVDEYKLPFHLLRWGGVYLTTGFDYSSLKLSFRKTFTESQTTTQNLGGLYGTVDLIANFTGTAIAGAEVSAKTIPVEISTHVQLLHVLTLFGGLGLDFNFGSAKAIASVNGNVTAEENADPSRIQDVTANAALNLGDTGSPSSMTARWFAGTQINITLLKLYAQLNHGIGQGTWSVNGGVRIAY